VARDDAEHEAPCAALSGDVEYAGGTFLLGAQPSSPFAFDNEQWSHEVDLRPFALARAPVTQQDFSVFVEERGYARRELWSEEGWRWRERAGARHPRYWHEFPRWRRRSFDRWIPLEPYLPVHHVSAHEADAYCRFEKRRLPSEPSGYAAAAAIHGPGRRCSRRANIDLRRLSPVPVDRYALESGRAIAKMVAMSGVDVEFPTLPGFEPGPYQVLIPWFGDHRVLRGGSFATRSRLLWRTWRNFYRPERCDVFAGFRTAALAEE
jgi:iron(II)-dependent oxidoreductase